MKNNAIRTIVTYTIVILYIYIFLYFSLKCPSFQAFRFKFIGFVRNREIGEALFIILFYLFPVSIVIWISQRIGKR